MEFSPGFPSSDWLFGRLPCFLGLGPSLWIWCLKRSDILCTLCQNYILSVPSLHIYTYCLYVASTGIPAQWRLVPPLKILCLVSCLSCAYYHVLITMCLACACYPAYHPVIILFCCELRLYFCSLSQVIFMGRINKVIKLTELVPLIWH